MQTRISAFKIEFLHSDRSRFSSFLHPLTSFVQVAKVLIEKTSRDKLYQPTFRIIRRGRSCIVADTRLRYSLILTFPSIFLSICMLYLASMLHTCNVAVRFGFTRSQIEILLLLFRFQYLQFNFYRYFGLLRSTLRAAKFSFGSHKPANLFLPFPYELVKSSINRHFLLLQT